MNWIIATGQAWKLYVALAGFSGALACFIIACVAFTGVGGPDLAGGGFAAWIAIGVSLAAATFLWFSLALRCPHCPVRLVWRMASTRPHSSWLVELATLERCPACECLLQGNGGPR
jgi:hypothetical protein